MLAAQSEKKSQLAQLMQKKGFDKTFKFPMRKTFNQPGIEGVMIELCLSYYMYQNPTPNVIHLEIGPVCSSPSK